MKPVEKTQNYVAPQVERIEIDNEISLQLESTPPIGPNEEITRSVHEYFNNNPFQEKSG